MSDSYQAIYDAVRSRISNGDVGRAVEEVARNALDMGQTRQILQQEFAAAAQEMQRPSAIMRPEVFPDGKLWCALYGENLQHGVYGFGETPDLACYDFDKNWHSQRLGAVARERSDTGHTNGDSGKPS